MIGDIPTFQRTNKIHFPGLNGLRFIAAFSVVLEHTELVKEWFGVPHARWSLEWAILNGDDAVTLFFALSGFLITYLLLDEHRRTGTIRVRRFYARRMLRIWPLYYLVVFIGFALLPVLPLEGYRGPYSPPTADALLGHLLFVPNALVFLGIYVVGLPHLWTIGIEEQFYLMWPPIVRRFARHLLPALIGIITLKMGLVVVEHFTTSDAQYPFWFRQAVNLLVRFRVENMAVGGIGAYLLFANRERALKVIFHPVVEKVVLALVIANIVFLPGDETPLANLALSVLYTLFMLNVACNPRAILKLEHPLLNRLGQISYGIYGYHLAVIHTVIVVLGNGGGLVYDAVLYALVTALTIGAAAASYRWFEGSFLRLKQRFAVVGDTPEYPKFEPQTASDGRAGGSM